jgi:hypothetical protein
MNPAIIFKTSVSLMLVSAKPGVSTRVICRPSKGIWNLFTVSVPMEVNVSGGIVYGFATRLTGPQAISDANIPTSQLRDEVTFA